jgi:hypothetical protein
MKNYTFINRIFILVTIILTVIFTQETTAQGCVAVRQMGGLSLCSTNSYNLQKGEFQVGANYRYFHSWRHFVGTEEQPQRQTTGGGFDANGKELGNAVNIYSHAADFSISYGASDRLQLNATIPYVNNERSQVLKQTSPTAKIFRYSVYAQGLADVRLSANYWIFDPKKAEKGNIMVGLGVKLNTGSHDETDDAPQANGTIQNVVMDQAIQPGDGGIGVSLEFQGFRKLIGKWYGFANGYYLFNPRESNGTFKSAAKLGLDGYNLYASPDQYFGRAGVMTTVDKKNNLSVSLAGRIEGIPAYDAIGGQVAYRRPGYVIAVESGISYRKGKHGITLFVPYNIVRNRIQSAANIADQKIQNARIANPANYVHVQGDAAFADYSINLGYTYRFTMHKNMKMSVTHL